MAHKNVSQRLDLWSTSHRLSHGNWQLCFEFPLSVQNGTFFNWVRHRLRAHHWFSSEIKNQLAKLFPKSGRLCAEVTFLENRNINCHCAQHTIGAVYISTPRMVWNVWISMVRQVWNVWISVVRMVWNVWISMVRMVWNVWISVANGVMPPRMVWNVWIFTPGVKCHPHCLEMFQGNFWSLATSLGDRNDQQFLTDRNWTEICCAFWCGVQWESLKSLCGGKTLVTFTCLWGSNHEAYGDILCRKYFSRWDVSDNGAKQDQHHSQKDIPGALFWPPVLRLRVCEHCCRDLRIDSK